jgi:hypothetical protein
MTVFFALQIALLAVGISIVMRVWRASTLDGILCLFVPGYVLIPMFKHWNDPDHDIRMHVAALFVLAGAVVWSQFRLAHEIGADADQRSVAAHEERDTSTGETSSSETGAAEDVFVQDSDETDGAADTTRPQVTIEIGPRRPVRRTEQPVVSAPAPRSREPDTPVRAPAPGEAAPGALPTPHQAIAMATFLRGSFERSTLGFTLDLPSHFHALAAGDVRRVEASQHAPTDAHEIAWVLHESVPLDSPHEWHVRVRWLSVGWVPAATVLDATRLLQDTQQGKHNTPLAGSGGALIGYAIAPSVSGAVADWVEERLPAGATASVLDCHAVRLGRHGVVEFTVTGAPPGAQALCDASVRLLARRTRFEAGEEYSPADRDATRAPYTLSALISGAP